MKVVENNVPIPKRGAGRAGRPRLYPWADMASGDSFTVSAGPSKRDYNRVWARVYTSFRHWALMNPEWRMVCRREPDGNIRFWKVAKARGEA